MDIVLFIHSIKALGNMYPSKVGCGCWFVFFRKTRCACSIEQFSPMNAERSTIAPGLSWRDIDVKMGGRGVARH